MKNPRQSNAFKIYPQCFVTQNAQRSMGKWSQPVLRKAPDIMVQTQIHPHLYRYLCRVSHFPFSFAGNNPQFSLGRWCQGWRQGVDTALFSSVQGNRKMATAKASQSSFLSVVSNFLHSTRGFHDRLELSTQCSSVSPDKKTSAEVKLSKLTMSWPCFQS